MAVAPQATILFTLVVNTLALTVQRSHDVVSFDGFVAAYGRSYVPGTEEYKNRRDLFEKRIEEVKNHNSKPNRIWDAAINHLSDRSKSELAMLRGLRPMRVGKKSSKGAVGLHRQGKHFLHQVKNAVVPDEISWLNLTSVKADTDQAACGSCWALATATMLAANSEINGYDRTYSPQELVDCVPNPHKCGGTGGCEGSTTELAMNWVMEKGLATSATTPYYGFDMSCKKNVNSASLVMSDGETSLEDMIHVGFHGPLSQNSLGLNLGLRGWERLAENEYEPLLKAVAFTGPVAVSVAADMWNSYGSGIFNDCEKDAVVDHAVTLIGYGSDPTKDNTKYWLIKNSWGPSWGESGQIRLLRHVGDEYCGTDNRPELGTGCTGGPSNVTVCGMCGILYDSVVAYFNPATNKSA
jgi:cathepsin L